VGPIKLISFHAKTEGSAVAHIEALLGRLSKAIAASFILAGDVNSCRAGLAGVPAPRVLRAR
jgi:hypothetical protein